MTEPAPDRAAAALKTIGMEERPVASLEREDALFVLTEGTLLYQDGAGTRRVTLRDLTRIHSDQEGLLRVETPAGTALTASLLGFEPSKVQGFFAQVRDATARVKQLPPSPLPTAVPTAKTFASVPATPVSRLTPSSPPAGATDTSPLPSPASDADRNPPPRPQEARPQEARAREDGTSSPAFVPESTSRSTSVMSTPTAPVQPVAAPAPDPSRRTERVVITSSGFSPATKRAEARPELKTEPRQTEGQQRSAVSDPVPGDALAAEPLSSPAFAETTVDSAPRSAAATPTLSAQAEAVTGLAGRLRFLGVVLFIGAVLLAGFQFVGGQRLEGLWTLLAGGVGTVTLTVLSEAVRLLAAMGLHLERNSLNDQSVGPEPRPLDVR
ncbi:hypothetical protein DEDE109153_10820 [Deinococcus deserti]|uniref:Uncharacterized protein n=1 Tax=Deinococcus deserti (strain DSM 17065 / CIP 109153 / LMG 22923 / VCD115) TaxID=546414 RepID=C1CX64_DEIDV|nr:hypothetical protein [Deinococcus deserti]ACO46781.1 Conserved hypothetical protein; putative membrane protein [Deinococcus deserti VCD115]